MLKRAKNKPQKGIRLMQIIFAYFPCLGDDGRGAHNTNFYRGPQRLSPGLTRRPVKGREIMMMMTMIIMMMMTVMKAAPCSL